MQAADTMMKICKLYKEVLGEPDDDFGPSKQCF